MAKGTKTKPPVEEDEDLELELEDEDGAEDDEEDAAPAKSKKAADDIVFGASDLAALLSKKTGKEIKTKDLRTLLRKMAREDNPRIQREVIPGNKSRYSWSGPDDPEVKKIIKAVTGGELEAGKREALEKLKEKKAAQKAAEAKAQKKGKKSKPAPVVEDDDDEDFELDED